MCCGHECAHVKDPSAQSHRNGSFFGSGEMANKLPLHCVEMLTVCAGTVDLSFLIQDIHSLQLTPMHTPTLRLSLSAS